MKLSPQGQLDVQSQAKILVTIAVVANLLLALVLSLMMMFGPAKSGSIKEAKEEMHLRSEMSPSTADARGMRILPGPELW